MITSRNFKYSKFNFPCGEMQVNIDYYEPGMPLHLTFEFENNEEIIELLLIYNALKHMNKKIDVLILPYVPFSRQDRVNKYGECFSLQIFSALINFMAIKKVQIIDPHSDVVTALIDNYEVISQHEVFQSLLACKSQFYLICPDGGALKKIYKSAIHEECLGVVECSKKRNLSTGEISGTVVHWEDFNGKECIIMDDICDGGRTFIEIAKILKEKNAGIITLMVSHGFFTKGFEVFEDLIDEIYTRKGRVK